MIDFIFVAIVIGFLLLVLAFIIKVYALGMIASMAIIVVGVYVLANGVKSIDNLLTLGLGVVCIGVGAYVFIGGALEKIQEL